MNDATIAMRDDDLRRGAIADGGANPDVDVDVERDRDSELTLDLRAVWSAIYRNRYLAIVVIALALAAGLAVTLLTTPIYQAEASIQIDQQAARVLDDSFDAGVDGGRQDSDVFLQTQLDIMRSRSLAERVATSLNLYRDNRFLLAMGQDVGTGTGAVLGSADAQRRRVVSMLMNNMEVSLPRDSRVATIVFRSPNAAVAQRIANSYAENFIVANLQRKYDASAYARNFLEQKLAETKQRLEESERASIRYARGARLIDAGGGATTANAGARSLVTSSLVQTSSALTDATNRRSAAQQRWLAAQGTPVMSLPEVQANGTIQSLVRDRSGLQARYAEESTRRREDFPSVVQLRAQITALDSQIVRQANQIRDSIRDAFVVAQRQEAALSGDIRRLEGETLAEQDRSVQLNILRREVDTSRTLYDGLLQRYREVSAAAGITANNISIVDLAQQPSSPILPRPFLNMALALLLGIALALLLVFARETFDDSIRSSDDIDRKLRVPFLGSVPVLPVGETPASAMANQRSAFSEAHYALRSALEFATPTGLPSTILCTSSLQGEGKSTTSVALARSFARVGRRVLIIDGDLRKPSLHRVLEMPSDVGLSNVLTRQLTLEEVTQATDTPNLSFVACGPLPPNPGELLASASIRVLLDDARRRYDLVLIDGPPVMGLADAPLFGAVVGGVVFVIEASRAHRGQAKIALRRLRAAKSTIVGAILTKFDSRQIGYGADYGYSYNYGVAGDTGPAKRRGFMVRRRAEAQDDAE